MLFALNKLYAYCGLAVVRLLNCPKFSKSYGLLVVDAKRLKYKSNAEFDDGDLLETKENFPYAAGVGAAGSNGAMYGDCVDVNCSDDGSACVVCGSGGDVVVVIVDDGE